MERVRIRLGHVCLEYVSDLASGIDKVLVRAVSSPDLLNRQQLKSFEPISHS